MLETVAPRVRLGHYPTPLEELPRLGDALGVRLLVKREDLSGLAYGGNKVRKLERLLAAERFADADVLITCGGEQSNHARETAAAAARLGKRAVLFLRRGELQASLAGNLLIDELLGAEVHLLDTPGYETVYQSMEAERTRLQGRGLKAEVIPLGGASGEGVLAWADGAAETLAQCAAIGVTPAAVVIAAGTGSTAIGFALGLATAHQEALVHGISASWSCERLESEARRLLRETTDISPIFEAELRTLELLRWDDRFVGPGYTVATEAGGAAVLATARRAGLVLDLTYTGKAMAGLAELVKEGTIARGSTVIYLHTGGSLELFARPTGVVLGPDSRGDELQ
jgi:1-aminocyclopropane-1-carboxylate deaminase/D-cysteine desulfhydrase-like pyridoxal-dependent ACC family enzyme